ATINHSEVAPYRRYQHISAFRGGKGFFVRFGKTLRWGQQKEDVNINANDEKAESAILKGQK
ncbi:MAG: hypothetical protein LBT27_00870, partial [Prevotellaceae bacterium]|nr:hypothetical protein [Prevotellaceae bacterium]